MQGMLLQAKLLQGGEDVGADAEVADMDVRATVMDVKVNLDDFDKEKEVVSQVG